VTTAGAEQVRARKSTEDRLAQRPEAAVRPVIVISESPGIGRAIALELGRSGYPVAVGYLTREREANEAQRNPVRRLARAADTAYMVRFLMSDEASFINGSHLPITGGSSMI